MKIQFKIEYFGKNSFFIIISFGISSAESFVWRMRYDGFPLIFIFFFSLFFFRWKWNAIDLKSELFVRFILAFMLKITFLLSKIPLLNCLTFTFFFLTNINMYIYFLMLQSNYLLFRLFLFPFIVIFNFYFIIFLCN